MNLENVAIVITGKSRPQYLAQTLQSWEAARGIADIHSFTVALGFRDEATLKEMVSLIAAWQPGCPVRIRPDSTAARASRGMGRAIAEATNFILTDPAVEFIVCAEEDIVVSDDVLEYFAWAGGRFAEDREVLLVNGHDIGGQGWDEPGIGALGGDADQRAARLKPYFNPWLWGTWRDRWTNALEPAWDYECNSGGALDSGHDWMVATRIIPRGKWLCVTPDASRSQNIGQYGGWAADPAKFESTQSASFRPHREQGEYVLYATDAHQIPEAVA